MRHHKCLYFLTPLAKNKSRFYLCIKNWQAISASTHLLLSTLTTFHKMRYLLVLCLITCIFPIVSGHYYSLLAGDYQPVGLTPSQTLKVPDYNTGTCLKTKCATYCDLDEPCLSFAVAPAQSMCSCLLYNSLESDVAGGFIGYTPNSLYYGKKNIKKKYYLLSNTWSEHFAANTRR